MFSLVQLLRRLFHIVGPAPHAFGVAAEFLPERDRDGVLQMCAARFQHVGEGVGFLRQALDEGLTGGDERRGAEEQRQTRRRGHDVVGRLAHVHVIVRVHARVHAARLAEDLRGAVGQHLVGVHVVRRPGAGLVDVDDELIAKVAGEDLVRRGHNRARDVGVEAPERGVGLGRRFLDEDRAGDEIGMRAQAADRKVLDGARGLHAVVRLGGNAQFAEWVSLSAKRHVAVHG